MLRNVRVYRLDPQWSPELDMLVAQSATQRFIPCASQEASRTGWTEVGIEGALVLPCGEYLYLKLRTESRSVPGQVLRRAVDARAAELEKVQGYAPGRKQRAEISELLLMEMMPKAFPKTRDTEVIIDIKERWLLIGATSDAAAEEVLETFRKSLTDFPVRPLATVRPLADVMKEWLLDGEAGAGFDLGDVLQLKGKGSVRYAGQELPFDEVRKHIEAGMAPASLEVSLGDALAFRLGAAGEMQGLTFLERITEEETQGITGDQLEDFKASLLIRAGVVRQALAALLMAGGGAAHDAAAGSPMSEQRKAA